MQCTKCGQEVTEDAIYCPHCTGERRITDRQGRPSQSPGQPCRQLGDCLGLRQGTDPADILLAETALHLPAEHSSPLGIVA